MLSRRARIVIALVSFVTIFVALEVYSYTRKSATWDEPQHLTSGYLALTKHEYRLDPEHPPFARVWAALPLIALGRLAIDTKTIDSAAMLDWVSTGQIRFSHQFLYVDNDADRLLYPARFMATLIGVLLGVLLFCWAHEWLGFWPATIALAGYTIEPNLAAHATLVTTDFGVTCFIFGAVYFLWRIYRHVSLWNVLGLALFFVLAIVTKFSALILIPLVLLLIGVVTLHARTLTVSRAVGLVAVLGLSAWMAVWFSYAFRYSPASSASWVFHVEDDPVVRQRVPMTSRLVHWVDAHHLVPNAFSQGFLFGQARARARASFLAGRYSEGGWWYYFPVAFLIKTPIGLLVLLLIGILLMARRWRQLGGVNALFVALPIALYGGWAMSANLNIGLRHILPVYPFVILFAAVGARELVREPGRAGRVVLGVVAALWLVEFVRVYPDNLAFFNQLVGGPQHGAEYLTDSNLDWGQDLKSLGRWMDRNKVSGINLAYFGTADPAYYGIGATYLPQGSFFAGSAPVSVHLPGYAAVSETILNGVYLDEPTRAFYRPLRKQQPVAVLGHSIRVYWIDRPWW